MISHISLEFFANSSEKNVGSNPRTEAICERARALQLRNGHKLKLHLLVMSLEAFGLTLFHPFFIKNYAIKMTTHFDLSKALTAKTKAKETRAMMICHLDFLQISKQYKALILMIKSNLESLFR